MQKIIPKKHLGQNFLADKEVLQDIVRAAELKSDDIVLEIGAGTGILTEALAKNAEKVIAVEKDGELAKKLELRIKNLKLKNVEIVDGDIRNFTQNSKFKIQNSQFKIVANIPYYLTGQILRNFLLEAENPPKTLVLMVQKEIALKITAKPPKANFLSMAIDYMALSEIARFVKASAFWPKPKVDSAVIKIIPKNKIPLLEKRLSFFGFLKIAFRQPRKTLANNLQAGFNKPRNKILEILKKNNLGEKIRAGELSLKQLNVIHNLVNEKGFI